MKLSMMPIIFFAAALVVCADDTIPSPSNSKPSDPQLHGELLQRVEKDQHHRKRFIEWSKQHSSSGFVDKEQLSADDKKEFEELTKVTHAVDLENTAWLKEVVEEHGWPTTSMVGPDGEDAAWLLVQHSDADLKFQRKCLDLMTALPKNEIIPSNLAYLTDRVLLAEGKKQIYGTQFTEENGTFVPRPLEDEANVDKLRAEVELPPLAEYAKAIKEIYTSPKK